MKNITESKEYSEVTKRIDDLHELMQTYRETKERLKMEVDSGKKISTRSTNLR
jgi:hypothetical protein